MFLTQTSFQKISRTFLALFGLGFLRVPGLGVLGWGGGGGGRVSAVYNSKTINYVEMKFGGAVENHKLINLV